MYCDRMIAEAQLHLQAIDHRCQQAVNDLGLCRVITVECNITADDCMVEYFTKTPLERSQMIRVEGAIKKLFGERKVEVHHCLDLDTED